MPSPTFGITADGNLPGINGGAVFGGCRTIVINGDEATTNNVSGVHDYGIETALPEAADTLATCAPLCGARGDTDNASNLRRV